MVTEEMVTAGALRLAERNQARSYEPFMGISREVLEAALSAQVQDVAGWQLVPKEPTEEMLDAYRVAETKKRFDIMSPYPTEEPEAGGGTIGYGYRAMLAAAPAKQEF